MRELISKAGFIMIGLFWGFVWLDLAAALLFESYNSTVFSWLLDPRSGPGIAAACFIVTGFIMSMADPEAW